MTDLLEKALDSLEFSQEIGFLYKNWDGVLLTELNAPELRDAEPWRGLADRIRGGKLSARQAFDACRHGIAKTR